MSPLLVLGAGEEQVAIFREARRRGVPTIGVDGRADRPGIALADEFLQMSTVDHEGIAAALRGRDLAGVVSTAADTCLESWWHLTRHFGTPWCPPAEAVAVSVDKSAFHRVAATAGIPTYRWHQSADLAELAAVATDFRFPVVVKPTDASGGRGVRGVGTAEGLAAALTAAAAASPSGQVIVEEFLVGRNHTVNVFLAGGQIELSVITDRRLRPGPAFLTAGNTAPTGLDPATETALLDDAGRLCKAVGLTEGPAHFDVILTDDGTRYVIEAGTRMAGNGFPQLTLASTGVDCIAALVDLVTGQPVQVTPQRRRPSWLHILASPLDVPGTLVGAPGLAAARDLAGVESVELFAEVGDTIQPFTEAGRKLGWIVASAESPDALESTMATALDTLALDIR